MSCFRRGKQQEDQARSEGRRVIPNVISRDLFDKIDFFKYQCKEEAGASGISWRRNSTKQGSALNKQESPKGGMAQSKVSVAGTLQSFHEQWNTKYPSNRIKTNRYTWWNFVPVALFIQFTKVVNCFYFVNMLLQFFPSIRTNEPQFVGIVLGTLILIGMVKEFLADFKRYKTDKASNALPAHLITGAISDKPKEMAEPLGDVTDSYADRLKQLREWSKLEEVTVRTDQLKVGDVIKVYDDEVIPADCFILASGSSLESQSGGQCFIATSTLDGERNLKPKMAIKEVQDDLVDLVTGKGKQVIAEVHCKTNPIPDLYTFEGDLKLVYQESQAPLIDLDLKQFVPRGAHVRNSGYVILMVLYTGNDTKLILNQGEYRFKQSHVDQIVNKILLINIVLLLLICGILGLLNYKFASDKMEGHQYIFEGSESAGVQGAKAFGSFFLINNSFIPIDLAVGLEMGKAMYVYFLQVDADMTVYDIDKNELVACSVKNFNLHEDLAQLDYMFCDKTGTLTQNELIFKAFKVIGEQNLHQQAAVDYEPSKFDKPNSPRNMKTNERRADSPTAKKNYNAEKPAQPNHNIDSPRSSVYETDRSTVDLVTPLFKADSPETGSLSEQCKKFSRESVGKQSTLIDFLRAICLCHDVTKVTNNSGKTFLTGPSQDELCLIEMVAQTGLVEFIDRDSSVFTIKVQGQIEKYRTIKFYDFTSARKMMTRIVQNVATGEVLAICKGADSAVLAKCIARNAVQQRQGQRLVADQGKQHDFSSEETAVVDNIEMFASQGYRTLTFAMKPLDSAEIDGVLTQQDVESCFTLLGASCVEDLMQLDVAQCLVDFKRAGIQTWMLTGDKGKTAKMIGVQCGMFQSKITADEPPGASVVNSRDIQVEDETTHDKQGSARTKNNFTFYEVNDSVNDIDQEIKKILELSAKQDSGSKLELLIDGGIFAKMLLSSKETLTELNHALNSAAAVIIYRASPKQKEQVVQFMRTHNPGKVTLSIGDGSNDVNMIQTAHVGVGILGKEGNQAASFSDYSIAEFRSVRKLILWHGRQFGQGAGDFICTCVFKNVAFSVALTMYNFYSGCSGLQPIDSVFWLGYNLIITVFQMGWTFLMDQDAPMNHAAKIVHRFPAIDNKQQAKHLPGHHAQPKDVYEKEEKDLRYHISDYYLFAKKLYQLPLVWRTMSWELLAVFSGIACFFIPFFTYDKGVANGSGKTEDLFTVAFAVYQANVLTHHMQMFVTIRNYTNFFFVTCAMSLSFLWPIMILLTQYNIFYAEALTHHLWHVLIDQFFYQATTILLSTAIVIIPIYIYKNLKMRHQYPQFFPTNQSTRKQS